MTDKDRADARTRGRALRSARVARARSIRRRIIAGSVALFVAAWLLITIVLISGHDPALASKASGSTGSSTTAVASTPSTATTGTGTSTTSSGTGTSTTTSSQTSGSASSSGSSASSGSGSSGGGVSSVTTSQS